MTDETLAVVAAGNEREGKFFRYCCRCGKERPVSGLCPCPRAGHGRQFCSHCGSARCTGDGANNTLCRSCERGYQTDYRKSHPAYLERHNATAIAWKRGHPAHVQASRAAETARRRKTSADERAAWLAAIHAEGLFTRAEAATLIGISAETLSLQVTRKAIQVARTEKRKRLFHRDEIDRYCRETRGRPGPKPKQRKGVRPERRRKH